MSFTSLIPLALKGSIALTVFGLGLQTNHSEVIYLLRTPRVFIRSMLSLFVVMPVFAAVVAMLFDLHPAVKIALVALAVSPIPPFLPTKEFKAGGKHDYGIGLLVTASVLATIVTPFSIKLLGRLFGLSLQMSSGAVAILMMKTILAPLALGIVVRILAPRLSKRIAGPVINIAMLVLLIAILPILFTARHTLFSLVGNGTLLAFAVFTLFGLGVGHFLGGPGRENRTVLALSTASRHPGVAAAIAQTNFPQQRLALAAILLFLLVNIIVSVPYVFWSKRSGNSSAEDSRNLAA